MQRATHNFRVRVFSAATALLGAWLILSAWLTHAPAPTLAMSTTVVGAVVLICAIVRFFARRTVALSWLIVALGAWTVASPWIFGVTTGDARLWNYIISGIVLGGIEAYSITSDAFRHAWRPSGTAPDDDSGIKRSS